MACVPSDQAPLPCDIGIRLLTGRTAHGFHPTQGRAGHQDGPEHPVHWGHGQAGKGVWQSDGGCSREQQPAGGPLHAVLRDLLGLERTASQELLCAGGSVKRALVMGSCQLDAVAADALLKVHDSDLRQALLSRGVTLPQEAVTLPQ